MTDWDEALDAPPEIDALEEAARWLIAAYCGRLDKLSMTLEGYHYFGRRTEYHAIRILSVQGAVLEEASHGGLECLMEELQTLSEFVVTRIVPGLRFTREHRDLQEYGFALIRQHDLSAHERLALIARHGTLAEVRDRLPASSGRENGTLR